MVEDFKDQSQSRISFFQNERKAEKLSRDQSLKKIKKENDHLGILSLMDENKKNKLIPIGKKKSKTTVMGKFL